ncbi:MAG: porin [Rhodoferax sp.]|nr:porin [Rhodoferax sp.]
MKKTLIALAVLAASGAAMSQVTVTGLLAMGYKATKAGNNAGTESSGLGVDTSVVYFTVKEDLGGGQKVEALLGVGGLDRSGESSSKYGVTGSNGPATGRDASLTYTNAAFGQIQLATLERPDFFSSYATGAIGAGTASVAGAGAPVIDMDNKLHEYKKVTDQIRYAVPLGPVTVALTHTEDFTTAGMGLGVGAAGQTKQRSNILSGLFKSGPLTLAAGYRNYDNRIEGGCVAAAPALAFAACPALQLTKDSLYNLQGAFDLGMAKIGVGYQDVSATNGMHQKDSMISLSMPLGALTLGAAWSRSETADAPNTSPFLGGLWKAKDYEGTANGYSVGVSYAMSKRTSVLARHAAWTTSGYVQYEQDAVNARATLASGRSAFNNAGLNYNSTASETSLLLVHTF